MDFNYVFFSGHFTCGCTLYKKMRHFCDIGLHPLLVDYNDLTPWCVVWANNKRVSICNALMKVYYQSICFGNNIIGMLIMKRICCYIMVIYALIVAKVCRRE